MMFAVPKAKPNPKKVAIAPAGKTIDVIVKLSPADFKNASIAAISSQETLPSWISSLVNTALMP
jgi:hypothetical protein